MHWCDTTQRSGLLLFADQDNAYPRVQWDYMFATMHTMNLHPDFITMVKTMYTDTNLRFKVNGVVDPHTAQPKNGIAQGCPLSPQLYLMCIQGLLSLMNRDAQQPGGLQGIEVPDERGNVTSTPQLYFSAFADDVCLFLRDEDQLPRFKHLLGIYEIGAGALNSWEKTIGMRIGTLRTSTHLPQGWVEGSDITFAKPLDDNAVRYLGAFLGAPEQVQRAWIKRTTEWVRDKAYRWAERSMPRTREVRLLHCETASSHRCGT